MEGIGSLILYALPVAALLTLVAALNRPGWRPVRVEETPPAEEDDAAV